MVKKIRIMRLVVQICFSVLECNIEPNVLPGKQYKSRYDLLSAIMVHLNEKTLKSENKLIGMLSALLSEELSIGEKKLILERDYDIPMTRKIEKEVIEMCNLSQSIYEKGIAEEQINVIRRLTKKGKSLEDISDATDLDTETIVKIQEEILSDETANFSYTNLF